MKKKYTYTTCSICKEIKTENRSPYCKKCSKEYNRKYKEYKKLKPNINIDGLGNFIIPIRDNDGWVNRDEFLKTYGKILFFYENLTNNISEYDHLPFNQQVELMWKRICEYYDNYNNK